MALHPRKNRPPANRQEWQAAREQHVQAPPEPYDERRHFKSFLKEVTLQVLSVVVIFGYGLFVGIRYDQHDLMLFMIMIGLVATAILPFFIKRSQFKWKEQPIEYDPKADLLYVHQWGSRRFFLQNSDPDSYSFSDYAAVTKPQTVFEQYIPWFNNSQTLVLRPIGSSEPDPPSWFDRVFRDVKPARASNVLVLKDVVDVGRILTAQSWHNSQSIRQNDDLVAGINRMNSLLEQGLVGRTSNADTGELFDDPSATSKWSAIREERDITHGTRDDV